ncbi:hypothetical protein K2Z84_26980 [Candidatus Binatia bacterium]|nr:hypothetical protein [Candidatus Binatia bacterium]
MTPVTPPGPASSTAQIILRDGDVLLGDLRVANIEDGALGTDGSAAVVVTIADSGNRSAVLLRRPDGSYAPIFDPRTDASGLDATSIARVRLATDGTIVFETGAGLDTDRLYRVADGRLEALAGAAPGPVFPDFRILGNVRLAPNGTVAFVGGGGECEVVVGDAEPRITCTNALYVAGDDGVRRLDDSDLDLSRQRATTIRAEIDPAGGIWFSLPRRGTAPMLLRWADGEATRILDGTTTLDGIGTLNSAEAVAISASGQVLIEGGLQEFTGDRRPQVLGVLDNARFAQIALEGTTLDGANIATLRGLGLDGRGRALFEARLGDVDAPTTQQNSLWFGDASRLERIVREGSPFPGEDITVLTVLGSRVNAAGDVAFLTELGSLVDGVAKLEEVRATVRRADGRLVTVASTRHTGQFGALSAMQIVGYDDAGTLLLIGTRGRSSDRVLLLGRSDG